MNTRRFPRSLSDVFTSRITYDWASRAVVDAMLDYWYPKRIVKLVPPWYVELWRRINGR